MGLRRPHPQVIFPMHLQDLPDGLPSLCALSLEPTNCLLLRVYGIEQFDVTEGGEAFFKAKILGLAPWTACISKNSILKSS